MRALSFAREIPEQYTKKRRKNSLPQLTHLVCDMQFSCRDTVVFKLYFQKKTGKFPEIRDEILLYH